MDAPWCKTSSDNGAFSASSERDILGRQSSNDSYDIPSKYIATCLPVRCNLRYHDVSCFNCLMHTDKEYQYQSAARGAIVRFDGKPAASERVDDESDRIRFRVRCDRPGIPSTRRLDEHLA